MKAVLIDVNGFKMITNLDPSQNRQYKIVNKRPMQRAYVVDRIQELYTNHHPEFSEYIFYLDGIRRVFNEQTGEEENIAYYSER